MYTNINCMVKHLSYASFDALAGFMWLLYKLVYMIHEQQQQHPHHRYRHRSPESAKLLYTMNSANVCMCSFWFHFIAHVDRYHCFLLLFHDGPCQTLLCHIVDVLHHSHLFIHLAVKYFPSMLHRSLFPSVKFA